MVDVLLQFASNPDLEVKLDRVGVKAFTQVSAFFPNELILLLPRSQTSWFVHTNRIQKL
jgi:hypothetical protein